MNIDQLNYIKDAPAKGTRLIYTRKKVIFGDYSSLDSCMNDISGQDILEVHLFDDSKEYRAISTESRRFTDDFLEHTAQFEEDDSVFSETCMLEDGGTITVLNHISFNDDNGMAYIDDYRIKRG